ncbi:ABC transporter ATP-binding protein [candidate division CSSED10-310 bacterium]|uniref:ABC transporter ATP-binding protein n=1 Tax=candidate division CSSED10-310 bacterium TaxID=2855610 RepID=A0ABV6YR39_UNCC1
MTDNNILVDVEDLKVHFPVYGGVFSRKVAAVKAVDGITFSVGKHETIGLVGESGCGKTTVGRAMINILRHMSPDVEIYGHIRYQFKEGPIDFAQISPRGTRPYRARVQMIFQDPYASLNPRMTVAQIISEPLRIHTSMKQSEMKERVGWLMDKVGLSPEQTYRYPHEFSGGQRQRVGIARALATNPELIICDEPVSALDVSIQAQVINLMMDLQDEFNLSYLFIAHDLSIVEHISVKIAVMYLGNIVEFGLSKDIFFKPRHPYSRALISAVPLPDPSIKKTERILLKGDVPTPLHKPSGCPFRTRCWLVEPSCAERMPDLDEHAPGHFVACPIVKE